MRGSVQRARAILFSVIITTLPLCLTPFMSSVRRIQERREEARRRTEEVHADTHKRASTDRMLAGNYASDDRVDQIRRARRQREIEEELAMEKQIEQNEIQREKQIQQREYDEQRARDQELHRRAALLDEKTRQRIREESPELRELEQQLKIAYLNKERSIQVEEQRVLRDRERLQDLMFAKEEEAYKNHLKKMDDERQMQRREEMIATRTNLEEQIKDREEMKKAQYDEFLREKLVIDAIVQKIYEEDQREVASQLRKQQETREYVENYLHEREDWKRREKERMEEENRKIAQYAEYKQNREDTTAAQKKIIQDEKNRIFEKLSSEADAKRQKQQELEQMRLEMHLEAEEERQRLKEKELLERRIQQRMDILQTNNKLLAIRAEQEAQRKAEDDAYGQQMMQKMAEMDRLDQMNAQKARLRKMEHKREVDRLLEERRRMYEQTRQAQLDEHNLQQQREEARRAIIEEERQKLLQEHAVKLYGYLPKELERELGIKGNSSPSSSRAGSPLSNTRPSSSSSSFDHSASPPRYEEQRGRNVDARNGSPQRSASPLSSVRRYR
eukprot:Phypoly_transcript_06260.p1 GENE.Phypoly_transcript_06260~~Phypoly_transcript_06260.p1  ORF type:complete len:560 (+),score=139.64 Phypoly_transcript_06260:77-1756(+)